MTRIGPQKFVFIDACISSSLKGSIGKLQLTQAGGHGLGAGQMNGRHT
jgi:hypothetical protein